MADYWMIYRDIEDVAPRKFFELLASPLEVVETIKDQVIPGWFGGKPIHIRWYHKLDGLDTLYLLTYTHEELSKAEVEALLHQAYVFLQTRN